MISTQESTNWLTVFPTPNEDEAVFLENFSSSLGNLPDTQAVVLAVDEALRTKEWNGNKLSETQLELLQRVWNHIEKGVSLGLDEAVNLKNRELSEKLKKKSREEMMDGDQHSHDTGDYRGNMAILEHSPSRYGNSQSFYVPEYTPHLEIGDTVNFLYRRIKQLLSMNMSKPVVCLDIGSMKGETWLELSKVFDQEIKEGKLILVATNISQPIKEIDPQTTDSLVQFIVADLGEIFGKELTLPNGKKYVLNEGSIDILHENKSISQHDVILDKDAKILTDLVGNSGMIMSSQNDISRGSTDGLSLPEKNLKIAINGNGSLVHKTKARLRGEARMEAGRFYTRDVGDDILRRAVNTLRSSGLSAVNKAKKPSSNENFKLRYIFWVGKNTPQLKVTDSDGEELDLEFNN